MNRLHFFIVPFLLLFSSFSFSQSGYLFVKKGIKKKRIYTEGDQINVRLQDGSYYKGTITLLRNDTIFIKGQPVYRPHIKEVLLKRKPKKTFPDTKTLLAIGGRLFRSFIRKKFRIGKKFRLQVLDFHIPQSSLKSF